MKALLYMRPRLGGTRPRSWGGLLVSIGVLLALSALCGWLLAVLKSAALPASISHGAMSGPLPLAIAPLATAASKLVFAAGLLGTVVAVWMAAKYAWRNDRERAKNWRRRQHETEAELHWSEATASPPPPLPPDDLRRIIWAMVEEVCAACDNVRKAQGDLAVEDYGEKLAAAEKSLNQVIQCLGDVMTRLNTSATGGGSKP